MVFLELSSYIMFKILIVEDEKNIREIVKKYLEASDYTVVVAEDGLEGLYQFNEKSIDLAILDLMMPKMDGFELLKEIRNVSDIPIILLTAKKSEVDRLNGFDYGADDYIMKPFSPKELIKRVAVLIRRVYGKGDLEGKIQEGDLVLNLKHQTLNYKEEAIDITATEFKLLRTFFENINQVLSREQLIEKSFGYNYEGFNRSIDAHIKRIRQKIASTRDTKEYIHTKYGAGYIFKGEDSNDNH